MTASTHRTEPSAAQLTMGRVSARGESYQYAMLWSMQMGKPVVSEVMPAPHPLVLPPERGPEAELSCRLGEGAPDPTVELDPVAIVLWSTELRESGLPFAVRCLAIWWRIQDRADPSWPHAAVAAAIAIAAGRAAGYRRPRAAVATTYNTDLTLVQPMEHELTAELRLDPARGW